MMLTDFGRVFIFFIIGAIFVAGGLIVSWLLRPKRPYPGKLTTYECGEEPVGGPWVRFNVRFYIVALVFVVFEMEIVYLFPWALVFQELGMFAFIQGMIFLFILILGYAYEWAKGDLDWDRPEPYIPTIARAARTGVYAESLGIDPGVSGMGAKGAEVDAAVTS